MSDSDTPRGSEEQQAEYAALREELMKLPPKRERVKLGEGGRFVIPAFMRDEMGIKPGEMLICHVVDGELRVRSYLDNIRRIQERSAPYKKPGESVVDEFLAERLAMWGEDE
ncbi:AbrB/MazE/SpoVT family DNA-binding domain-containing protein [Georhizobium sp. MAB10]|jgi:AbrB family looped-hinge helix DNA binding protein|uniref:AbrB/MazE/SpoVT family DNA-binding domain-containing protein n=1 Tax=Georhizobium sp. MAB10 TaxID=3028319 RepID=UPI003855F2B6